MPVIWMKYADEWALWSRRHPAPTEAEFVAWWADQLARSYRRDQPRQAGARTIADLAGQILAEPVLLNALRSLYQQYIKPPTTH